MRWIATTLLRSRIPHRKPAPALVQMDRRMRKPYHQDSTSSCSCSGQIKQEHVTCRPRLCQREFNRSSRGEYGRFQIRFRRRRCRFGRLRCGTNRTQSQPRRHRSTTPTPNTSSGAKRFSPGKRYGCSDPLHRVLQIPVAMPLRSGELYMQLGEGGDSGRGEGEEAEGEGRPGNEEE